MIGIRCVSHTHTHTHTNKYTHTLKANSAELVLSEEVDSEV